MLKNLISKFGKDKINTLTKYPSILTLHKLGERGRLTTDLTTDITNEQMYATEKIDGTNVRIVMYGNEYLIGSRENILHHNNDLYYDPAQTIVDGFYNLEIPTVETEKLTIVFGEYFGGKVSSNSKQYGSDHVGFRVFDIVEFADLSMLDLSLTELSRWRETETPEGLIYGQPFLSLSERESRFPEYQYVPHIEFKINGYDHVNVLESLRTYIPTTNVALSSTAGLKPEGVILRNANRTKIVKVRYEDYERSIK